MNEYSISIDLTDGWIPVIDGKCSLPLEFCQSIECRFDDGQIRTLPYGGGFMSEIIAVRLIKKTDKFQSPYYSGDPFGGHAGANVPEPAKQESIDQETPQQRLTRETYLAYRAKHPEPRLVLPIGEEQMNKIAAVALMEHDRFWPKKI